jgi:DNA-binding transcriptional regulator PaaX
MVVGTPRATAPANGRDQTEAAPSAPAPVYPPAWLLGVAAAHVYLAAYDQLGPRAELNRAQVAYELAKLVLAGPLAQSIVED